ncbi:YbaB/EbfC family nucleoid-associated protein, partial [Coprococcus eutactus]|uniref:YbaB/EbfC family nucleoid-associated protein n=1 Tax=Coprococcus eutactus TaxID=33043 RepID=UPI00210C315D
DVKKELMEIKLDSEFFDTDDKDTLEELIISSVNEALRSQEEDYNNNMSKISAGIGLGGLPF